MTTTLSVLERRTEKKAIATTTGDGRYELKFEDGESREVAESTFKRLFTVLEDNVQQPESTPEAEPEVTNEVEQLPEVETNDEVAEKEEDGLAALLSDAEEIKPEAKEDKPKPEEVVPVNNRLEELGLGIKVRDWGIEGTKGGKTEKVKSLIEISKYLMEITEYDGYITNVVLFEELDEADVPENDPDATTKMVYRSPKMSLKDTLEWMGLGEDDAKLARKEITAIRKQVKLQAKEQSSELEPVEG